jgi:hypothetical protein
LLALKIPQFSGVDMVIQILAELARPAVVLDLAACLAEMFDLSG